MAGVGHLWGRGPDTAQLLDTAPPPGFVGIDGFSAQSSFPANFGLQRQSCVKGVLGGAAQKMLWERPEAGGSGKRTGVPASERAGRAGDTSRAAFRICGGSAGSGRSFVSPGQSCCRPR